MYHQVRHFFANTRIDSNHTHHFIQVGKASHIAHCTTAIVKVTLKCIYLFFIIEIFQHNTHRLIYFEGLET